MAKQDWQEADFPLVGERAVTQVEGALAEQTIAQLLSDMVPLIVEEAKKTPDQRARTSTSPGSSGPSLPFPSNPFQSLQMVLAGRTFQDYRLNTQVDQDMPELATTLWEILRPHLLEISPQGDWKPSGINERMRIVRYEKGERTTIHTDGAYRKNENERSKLTLMIYLNEGFTGGETNFYNPRTAKAFLQMTPKAGKALLFDHLVVHEGSEVIEGTKYILRTDVMFTRENPSTEPLN